MTTLTNITTTRAIQTLSADQQQTLAKISNFLGRPTTRGTFILNGAAGTGKTTIIARVCTLAQDLGLKVCMMAPTGRAAKVLSSKVETRATTIHSTLYYTAPIKNKKDEVIGYEFIKRPPYDDTPALFIVDEASMVSDSADKDGYMRSNEGVLKSLIDFCFGSSPGSKLLFVGDKCQLSPINGKAGLIPALDKHYLEATYRCDVSMAVLDMVMRQAEASEIAVVAQQVRQFVLNVTPAYVPTQFKLNYLKDADQAVANFCKSFDPTDPTKVVLIAFMNVVVMYLNQAVRKALYHDPEPVEMGEYLVVSRNTTIAGVPVLNGELIKIQRVLSGSKVSIEGINFVTVEVSYTDFNGDVYTEQRRLNLTYLQSETGQVPFEYQQKLIANRIKVNEVYRETREDYTDEYLNALCTRYSYALSCHKAQGGEWEHAIIADYASPKSEPYRYLYTAITRASKKLQVFKPPYLRSGN
jgi:hypothetical protein